MPAEIDFSGGTRGKLYQSGTRLELPLYLDPNVQAGLIAIAATRGVSLSDLANDLLRKAMAILKAGK
jgi:hypothetical protein